MALTADQKVKLLNHAIEITKAAAGSGAQGCYNGDNLAAALEKTYNKMVELLEKATT
jgi:hypothetical protein